MKVTFIALESYSIVGGLQQFNRRIVDALSNLFENFKINQPSIVLKGDESQHIKSSTAKVNFIACGQSRFKFIKSVLSQSKQSDILLVGHVNLLSIAYLAKKINPKLRTILFVHGEDVWNTENARPMKPWEPFLAQSLDGVASVSSFTAERMYAAFKISKQKFTIFPNAVDPLIVESTFLEKKPILLTVARLAKHDWGKHHDSVLKALPKVLEKIPEAKYRIIGDGVLRSQLEKLVNTLEIAHAVEFTGRVSDEDLAKSYQEASLFVMPSEKEGFGIVFLEAWLYQIPVICGTEDASNEVITNGVDGFAIHHDDIDELANKITYLLTNPDQAQNMGVAGNEKVSSKYMMENFITNLEALLQKINSVK